MKPVNTRLTYRQHLKDQVLTYDAVGVKQIIPEILDANVPPTRLLNDSHVLKANGIEVMDRGCDVKAAAFVERAKELDAHIIVASSVMSNTRPYQRETIEELERASCKGQITVLVGTVLVGSSPCTLEWTQSIGADGCGHDVVEAVAETKWLLGIWA